MKKRPDRRTRQRPLYGKRFRLSERKNAKSKEGKDFCEIHDTYGKKEFSRGKETKQ